MLRLIEADKKYLGEYKEAYLLEKDLIEKGITKKRNQFFINPDEIDIIKKFEEDKDNSEPTYDLFAVDDDKLVGIVNLRPRLTPALFLYGGHIGYGVNPKYRKMGYGTKMLNLAISKYKDLIEEDSILITCDDDNIGSYKIIEANGGKLENKIETEDFGEKFTIRRYWIEK